MNLNAYNFYTNEFKPVTGFIQLDKTISYEF